MAASAFGNVSSGLAQMLRSQDSKLQFAQALHTALANPIPQAPDRISLFQEDIRTLDKTLRLRLSLLPLDRPQSWFRTSPPMDKNPITSTVFRDPIFLAFEDQHAETIKKALPMLWQSKSLGSEFYDPGFSLWGRLLKMNLHLSRLNQMASPFQDILFEDMPEAIPDELMTPSLQLFGTQLASRIKACQRDLESCYRFLWARSESFLAAQSLQHLAMRARTTRGARPEAEGSESFVPKRRLGPLEEALQFMSFSRLPNFEDLRSRYRSMAQSLHPDRGGNEERFKLLSVHYQALLKQLQRF